MFDDYSKIRKHILCFSIAIQFIKSERIFLFILSSNFFKRYFVIVVIAEFSIFTLLKYILPVLHTPHSSHRQYILMLFMIVVSNSLRGLHFVSYRMWWSYYWLPGLSLKPQLSIQLPRQYRVYLGHSSGARISSKTYI